MCVLLRTHIIILRKRFVRRKILPSRTILSHTHTHTPHAKSISTSLSDPWDLGPKASHWLGVMYVHTHTHLSHTHTHTQTPQAYLHVIIRPQGSWAQSLWSAGCDVRTYTTHTHTPSHTTHTTRTPHTHTHTQHHKPISTSSSDPRDLEPKPPHWLGPAGLGCLPGTLPLGAGAPAVVLVDEEEHHQPRAQEGQHGQEGGVVRHDVAATAAQLHVREAWLVLDAADGQVEGVVALVDRQQGRGVQVDGHQLLRLVQVAGEGGETTHA